MYEAEVIEELKKSGVGLALSLPCDKNKRFTDILHESIRTVDLAKEEDGVGIAAGAYMAGTRSVISIQSSGLGNMMNAIMSLTDCYRLPLAILASWRGVDDEKIEAQRHFNLRIPRMLDSFGIDYIEIDTSRDIAKISPAIKRAYSEGRIVVFLMHPHLWVQSDRLPVEDPPRPRSIDLEVHVEIPDPKLTRSEAIATVMDGLSGDTVVVSNIGVPSKEVFACSDRPLNFYMLGSFGQATPIALGIALCCRRRVVSIDGDGSLLTDNILPVVASEKPGNLSIICLDNGTFGSTGNQTNHSYRTLDMGCFALGCGIRNIRRVADGDGLKKAMAEGSGSAFIQYMIKPGNSKSPNIPLSAVEIRDRFMEALNDRTRRSE